ncbi:carbohydrate ABC transporter permease [Aestuariimicrobium ganziense]|uniref:carbohydrate ABC transporter permease n=1 Tax=Aestuariimicrobium ganziense TaxID=2773677 RepID=UPI0019449223|nr:carbohydrate ABC transporter permease [Aestuariimicrobium ganziense]
MRRSKTSLWVNRILLWLVCLAFLFPIVWLFGIAIKTREESAAFPTVWWPSVPQWQNFTEALTAIDFLGYARNSTIIALISAVLGTLSSSYIAFGFAKLRGPGKKVLFGILLGTMMLPAIVTTIPLYIMFSKIGLTDTYVPWVLWGLAGSAFNIFLFRQNYLTLPEELEEAAIVDGCNYFQIWWRIYLPLSKPIMAAVFLLGFVWAWGDFFTPLLLLSRETTTLAVAPATQYIDPMGRPIPPLIAAGAFMFAAPVIVLFIALQRYFVQGFATSGVK